MKLLREHNIHAVGYLAELSVKLAFIWASVNRDLVTQATHNVQAATEFPRRRFIDAGAGYVRCT